MNAGIEGLIVLMMLAIGSLAILFGVAASQDQRHKRRTAFYMALLEREAKKEEKERQKKESVE